MTGVGLTGAGAAAVGETTDTGADRGTGDPDVVQPPVIAETATATATALLVHQLRLRRALIVGLSTGCFPVRSPDS